VLAQAVRRQCNQALRSVAAIPDRAGIARRWLSGFAAITSVLAAALGDRYISADFPK